MNNDSCSFAVYQPFLTYLETVKYRSKYTIRNYGRALKRFFDVTDLTSPDQITHERIEDFRFQLKGELSNNWIEFHIIALKSYLLWCFKRDIPAFPYYKVETNSYEPVDVSHLSRDEVEKMFNISHKRKILSLRNTAIMRTFYSTGCRVSELLTIKRWQVNSQEVSIIGKGSKPRVVFLSLEASASIKTYLEARTDKSEYLFVSHGRNGGKALSKEMVEKIVRDKAKEVGLSRKVTPHTMRHTFATQLLYNGADICHVQEMLGHSSILTTQRYLHVTNQRLRETHQACHS